MTLFVAGRLSVTPIKLKLDASIAEIRSALVDAPYSGLPGQGWGSIFDGVEELGSPGKLRPAIAKPQVLEPQEGRPERVVGRYYYDEYDKRAFRYGGEDPALTHIFRGCDVAISRFAAEPGHFTVLIAAGHTSRAVGKVVEGLRSALIGLDETIMIFPDSSPVAFSDSDFFRWLLYRSINDPDVTVPEPITLHGIRHIASQDFYARGTSLSDGADIDRPELLALVAGQATAFGPVKVDLKHDILDLRADIEIRADGGFAIKTAESYYGNETGMSREDKNLSMVEDVAYRVIPSLTTAWLTDTDWQTIHKPKFMEDARADLLSTLLGSLAGPVCTGCNRPTP